MAKSPFTLAVLTFLLAFLIWGCTPVEESVHNGRDYSYESEPAITHTETYTSTTITFIGSENNVCPEQGLMAIVQEKIIFCVVSDAQVQDARLTIGTESWTEDLSAVQHYQCPTDWHYVQAPFFNTEGSLAGTAHICSNFPLGPCPMPWHLVVNRQEPIGSTCEAAASQPTE